MATMTSAVLLDIQDEVTCPICLELLKEPLSIDCGHSFCQACITENSKESQMGQEEESSCPVCQTSYQLRNLRPNRHLANIAERLRGVVLGSGEPLKVTLCAHHREKLQLFCKEDGKLICWLCERSQEHHGHHTFLMEEVAQEYQEKFQESLKRLRQEQQEAEKLKAVIIEKRTSWKNQMEPERHRIQTEFNQLRSILDKEEQRQLKKLEEEERKGLNIMEEAEDELAHQSQALKELISDLERRCQGSTVELLQDASDVTERYVQENTRWFLWSDKRFLQPSIELPGGQWERKRITRQRRFRTGVELLIMRIWGSSKIKGLAWFLWWDNVGNGRSQIGNSSALKDKELEYH
ncbi:tripartite motif-containing protein 6-like isoform X1 [Myotis daubentonii]|uniref:tripartite motif-containing protein 6-like isoform X1 n=1 Tax=Myotis daubentonii TaxID=98922 RepID=UPI0028737307|nr:tripartite motif-containing protein 6-like isoform X1 [Myotis daubentonii]